jgi:hypothetical protein
MRTAGGPVAENMRLYVYRRGTTTQQQLYSSETGIGTVGQPLTANSEGLFPNVWVPTGSYDLYSPDDQVNPTVPWESVDADDVVSQGVVNVKNYGAKGDGTTDDYAAIVAAYNDKKASHSGNYASVIFFPAGIYRVGTPLVFNEPVVLMGETSYGTRLKITSGFPSDGYLLTWIWDNTFSGDENHLPGGGLRNIGLSGNGRATIANAIHCNRADRMQFIDVRVSSFKGSAIRGDGMRECQFVAFRTWLCGDPTHPCVDLFDQQAPPADGNNLNQWDACQFALTCGDEVHVGSASDANIVYENRFMNCVFHGMPEIFDGYVDHPDTPVLEEGDTPGRHVIENGRGIYYDGCYFIYAGRGMPLFYLKRNPTVGDNTLNLVGLNGGNTFQLGRSEGYFLRTITNVSTSANTFEVTGYPTNRHHLQTGARVQVENLTGTTPPSPLAADTDYYAIVVNTTTLKLATSRANALAGTAIDLTTTGTGATSLQPFDSVFTADSSTDTLTVADHRLSTGARIWFASTGTLPAPLLDTPPGDDPAGVDYFAIRVDKDHIKVATTRANAKAGTAINLSTNGTGTHWFSPVAFHFDIEQGTLSVSGANTFAYVPTRAYARTESPLAALAWATTTSALPDLTIPLQEASDGGTIFNRFRGVLVIQENNSGALYSYLADAETPVQMARVSNADVVLMGGITGGAAAQFIGSGTADLVVGDGGDPEAFTVRIRADQNGVGFNGGTPGIPNITGSRGGNAALADLLNKLTTLGLITNSTSA